jgi:hypothetical protein
MSELLQRLRNALPQVQGWINQLLAAHAGSASTIDVQRFGRLPDYLPSHVLHAARFVVVERTPFPPVPQLGVPEFERMESMAMGGITFGQTYFLTPDHAADEGTHLHELIHTIQWSELGVRDFLLTYGLGLAMFGYEQSPLESVAYSVQESFARAEQINDLEQYVRDHALQTRSHAKFIFASNQVTWDA